jgi:AraC-like DNA-binding protein
VGDTQGNGDLGLDEIGLILLKRFVETVSQWPDGDTTSDPRLRKRATNAALWIDENSHQAINLSAMAKEAGLSPFHFLRTFSRTMGVTPHQYLVRSRLRRAARLLADPCLSVTHVAMDVGFNDLSNFVRTFRRASGMSPSQFRRVACGERKILQD